jgi:hypothetical protein
VIVFQWTSASILTIVFTGAVYWLLTRFVVIPLRKGGYVEAEPVLAPAEAVPGPSNI